MFEKKTENIIYLYSHPQPLYDEIRRTQDNIQFIQGFPDNLVDMFQPYKNSILVIDDILEELKNDKRLQNLYICTLHHMRICIWILYHNMFEQGSIMRTLSLNTKVFC